MRFVNNWMALKAFEVKSNIENRVTLGIFGLVFK